MPDAARKRATYADLEALPDDQIGEIVGGELHASPRPAGRHSRALTLLAGELHAPFRMGRGGPGGWEILIEPELHLGGDVLVPDVAGWQRERVDGDQLDVAAISIAPDWVCEVISPRTGRHDRAVKLPAYGVHGVAFAWLIDPALQTLEAYRRDGAQWVLHAVHAGSERVRVAPFEALELELALLWGGDGGSG